MSKTRKLPSPGSDSIGAGAPEDEFIVTPAMVTAGVAALEAGLIDDCSIRRFRADLVKDIYLVMRAEANLVFNDKPKSMDFIGEGS